MAESSGNDDFSVRPIRDLRMEVLRNTMGAFLLGYELQAQLADIRHALDVHDHDLCHAMGRSVVMTCLSIRSICRTGNYCRPALPLLPTYDPYRGLESAEIQAARLLIRRCAETDDTKQLLGWYDDVRSFAHETEKLLQLGDVPELRSRSGVFWLIRLARTWDGVGRDLCIPSVIPRTWSVQ